MEQTVAVTPSKTMRGHTENVFGVVHLLGGQRIITCSGDSSLRLWDLVNGAQIGDEWRDEGDEAGVVTMALSSNGKTIASGSNDGTVRLWDAEMGKVVIKWKGHSKGVRSVCWSPSDKQVMSGSWDGTARVWDVKSGEPVLGLNPIKTGHEHVLAVSYSPGEKMIATGGYNEDGINIWDAKTGKRLSKIELKDNGTVWSLAWTSRGEKLIAGSTGGLIRIFNTATWQQIAVLAQEGPTWFVHSLALFPNDRLLASTSWDNITRLWNLDTNLEIGPYLQHDDEVKCAAFSADGKLLSTGCNDNNAYVWDIQAILNTAGLEDLLSIPDKAYASSHNSLGEEHNSRRLFLEADATRGFDYEYGLSPTFFHGTQANIHSSAIPGARAKFSALLGHFPSLLRRSRPNQAIETRQPPVPSESRSHALLNRLSPLRRSPPSTGTNETSELSQPSMLSRFRPQELLGHLSSLFPRPQLHADEATGPQRSQTPSEPRPGALIDRLSSLFRSPPNADEAIELQHCPGQPTFSHCTSHVANVSAMRDREVIFTATRPETASEIAKRFKNPKPWVRVVLFLCCVSPGTDDSPGINAGGPGINAGSPGTNAGSPGINAGSPGTNAARSSM